MADIADIADVGIEAATADAVARAVGKSGPQFDSRFNGTDCVECEQEIPLQRRLLGKVRCITCQQWFEERGA